MKYAPGERPGGDVRHDVVTIPTFWVALLLSLHVHFAMLWFWLPRLPHPPGADAEPGTAGTVLVTRLAPTPAAEPAAAPPPSALAVTAPPTRAATPAARRAAPALARAPARSAPPPVLTSEARVPDAPSLPAPPPVATPMRPPPVPDLAAYVEARRRARGDPVASADAPETESQRRDRIVAANLASGQAPATFGYDPKSGGGVFTIQRIGYDDAEFWFLGLDRDIGRRAKQLIEVRRGANADIRQAIVRKMIAIIRDETKEDFTWLSQRRDRRIVLSARPEDNAALEAFLMDEFFAEPDRRGERAQGVH